MGQTDKWTIERDEVFEIERGLQAEIERISGKGQGLCMRTPTSSVYSFSATSFSYFFFITLTEDGLSTGWVIRYIHIPSREICPDEIHPSGKAATI